jgi:hypothetical protein
VSKTPTRPHEGRDGGWRWEEGGPCAEQRKEGRVGAPVLAVIFKVGCEHVPHQVGVGNHYVVLATMRVVGWLLVVVCRSVKGWPVVPLGGGGEQTTPTGEAYKVEEIEADDGAVGAHPLRHNVPRRSAHHVLHDAHANTGATRSWSSTPPPNYRLSPAANGPAKERIVVVVVVVGGGVQ